MLLEILAKMALIQGSLPKPARIRAFQRYSFPCQNDEDLRILAKPALKEGQGPYGLERSLLIYGQDYRYSVPPSNRKDTKSRTCSFRGQDAGVMDWFAQLPESVFQFPSESNEGGTRRERCVQHAPR